MNYHGDLITYPRVQQIKGVKYPGVTLGIDEFVEAVDIASHMNMTYWWGFF